MRLWLHSLRFSGDVSLFSGSELVSLLYSVCYFSSKAQTNAFLDPQVSRLFIVSREASGALMASQESSVP